MEKNKGITGLTRLKKMGAFISVKGEEVKGARSKRRNPSY